jgi:hypothetical protein
MTQRFFGSLQSFGAMFGSSWLGFERHVLILTAEGAPEVTNTVKLLVHHATMGGGDSPYTDDATRMNVEAKIFARGLSISVSVHPHAWQLETRQRSSRIHATSLSLTLG